MMDREEEIDWSEPETLRSKCAKAGLSYGAVITRINVLDWPLERALTTPVRGKTRKLTFAGQTKSVAEWAASLGITKMAIHHRLRKGWSLKRTLTTTKVTTIDRSGSLKARVEAAGLSYSTVYHRIHTHGWTEERALTTPGTVRPTTLKARCEKAGVSYGMVLNRLDRGWTLDNAMSIPKSVPTEKVYTCAGQTKTLKAWAASLGLCVDTISHRLRMGWPLERVLTTRSLNADTSQSLKARCRVAGLNYGTVSTRIREYGWTEERALSTPAFVGRGTLIAFNGQKLSIYGWARYTGIEYATIERRLMAGWPVEKALTLRPVNINPRKVAT